MIGRERGGLLKSSHYVALKALVAISIISTSGCAQKSDIDFDRYDSLAKDLYFMTLRGSAEDGWAEAFSADIESVGITSKYREGYPGFACKKENLDSIMNFPEKDRLIPHFFLEYTSRSCVGGLINSYLNRIDENAVDYHGVPFSITVVAYGSEASVKSYVGNSERWSAINSRTPNLVLVPISLKKCAVAKYLFEVSTASERAGYEQSFPRLVAYFERNSNGMRD